MNSKKSLKINQKAYKHLLAAHFKHKYYFSAFNSLRKQNERFSEVSVENPPLLSDYSLCVETLDIELPYPVSSPHIPCEDEDRSVDLLNSKEEFQRKVQQLLFYYKRDRNWLTKKYAKNVKYAKLPKYMIDLCTGQIADPDPFFDGKYNWYYTGGVLDCVQVEDCPYFIHPNSENCLCLTSVDNTNALFPWEGITKAPIYNVKAYKDVANFFLTIRQKNEVHVLKLLEREGNGLSAKTLLTKTSKDVPYIDIKYKEREVAILEFNHKLKIIDLRQEKRTVTHKFLKQGDTSDSFSQIEYRNPNGIVFLDRNSMLLMDKKSLVEKKFVLDSNYFKCDHFCAMLLSQMDDNYVFACSTHSIFKIDLRQMTVVKKWSHMLSSPPLMMKSMAWHEGEIMFMSASDFAERVVLYSNRNESNLVQAVPNNMESLRECNLTYNFNSGDNFKDRLKFNTTGIHVAAAEDDRVSLFTCNCNGDIFQNEVRRGHKSSLRPVDRLNEWISALPEKPAVLEVTSLREMSKWKFALLETNESDLSKSLAKYAKENALRFELLAEIDTYDTDMATIWRPEGPPINGDDLPPPITSTHKVAEWLQSNGIDKVDVSEAFVN